MITVILYNLCPGLENLSAIEKVSFWTEAQNHRREFSETTIS